MAYYNYKHVRDSIPKEFQEPWEKQFKETTGRDYEGTCDYDGDLWILASFPGKPSRDEAIAELREALRQQGLDLVELPKEPTQ